MLSLVIYHTAAPKRLLGISYMTSDGRASSAAYAFRATEQERVYIPYCCSHTRSTQQEHASARRATTTPQILESIHWGISNISRYSDLLSICRLKPCSKVNNRRHVFRWPTERRQLSDRLLVISHRSCYCASSYCVIFSSFSDPPRIFRYWNNNLAVENTSENNAVVAELLVGNL